METTGLFNQNNPDIKFSQLCVITKDRIESFLPGLWEETFKINNSSNQASKSAPSPPSVSPTPEKNQELVVEATKVEEPEIQKQDEQKTLNDAPTNETTVNVEIDKNEAIPSPPSSPSLSGSAKNSRSTTEIKDI